MHMTGYEDNQIKLQSLIDNGNIRVVPSHSGQSVTRICVSKNAVQVLAAIGVTSYEIPPMVKQAIGGDLARHPYAPNMEEMYAQMGGKESAQKLLLGAPAVQSQAEIVR